MRYFFLLLACILVIGMIFFMLLDAPEMSSGTPFIFFMDVVLLSVGIFLLWKKRVILDKSWKWTLPFSVFVQKSMGYKDEWIETEPAGWKKKWSTVIITTVGVLLILVAILSFSAIVVQVAKYV